MNDSQDVGGRDISPLAWVAPDCTIRGNVLIGPGSRVMHGARLVAEGGGRIVLGRNCIVLENAVIRATARQWPSSSSFTQRESLSTPYAAAEVSTFQ